MIILLFLKVKQLIQTIDQLGNGFSFVESPRRIISLVPSISELICDLGKEDCLVGCTSYCVHPTTLSDITKVGGTKKVDIALLRSLSPDLIIANKEENTKSDILKIQEEFKVWVSDVKTHEDAMEMTMNLSFLLGKSDVGKIICQQTSKCLEIFSSNEMQRTLYLIWRKPYMSVGGDTYIHDIMEWCGYQNVCGDKKRYPKLSIQDIEALSPEIILLSSEPFPFKAKHIYELQKISPNSEVYLADGEFFSWYGSRQANLLNAVNLGDIVRIPSG